MSPESLDELLSTSMPLIGEPDQEWFTPPVRVMCNAGVPAICVVPFHHSAASPPIPPS